MMRLCGTWMCTASIATMSIMLTSMVYADTSIRNSNDLFEYVRDRIVIVQCDDSSGSGFVCELDGKRYFVTNRHVVEGQTRVVAIFTDGRKLKFGKMEVAEDDVDLVRFQVATNQPALKLCADAAKMRQQIVVFGNSDGGGVLTDLSGEVVGIGPGKIEISAAIVHGNSGSAVLDENGKVLGVASFATQDSDPKDWVKKDTRFTSIRRWALTLENVKWKKMDLKTLYRITKSKQEDRQRRHGIYPQTRASFKAPSLRINKWQTYGDPVYWINGNIVLGLSNAKDIKNPVVRVALLVDCGNEKVVMDSVAVKPGGDYRYSYVPVYSYGMQSSGRTFEVGDSYVYYLEAISYYQREGSLLKAKDIEYFNRNKLLRGGFRLPDNKIVPNVVPKIIAYRLECWQNGSLAGVYNSTRPDTLNSKNIPVDWFIVGRYSKLFSYCETRYEEGHSH